MKVYSKIAHSSKSQQYAERYGSGYYCSIFIAHAYEYRDYYKQYAFEKIQNEFVYGVLDFVRLINQFFCL